MRRAATEEGLWERLAAEITPPASRAAMAAGFLDVYRAPAGAASAAAAG